MQWRRCGVLITSECVNANFFPSRFSATFSKVFNYSDERILFEIAANYYNNAISTVYVHIRIMHVILYYTRSEHAGHEVNPPPPTTQGLIIYKSLPMLSKSIVNNCSKTIFTIFANNVYATTR